MPPIKTYTFQHRMYSAVITIEAYNYTQAMSKLLIIVRDIDDYSQLT